MNAELGQDREMGKFAMVGHGITKSFDGLRVLQDMSVNIPRGVTYCLLGPNGSGKTTLMRAIIGLTKLDSGDVYVLDTPLNQISKVFSKIGCRGLYTPISQLRKILSSFLCYMESEAVNAM